LAEGLPARLAEFDAARLEFEEAVRAAPDAALRFKPEGEDYALGGLVVHVAQVLRRYATVVDTIRAADWGSTAGSWPAVVTTGNGGLGLDPGEGA